MTKQAAALIQPCTNADPAYAAVAIAFDNDPEILGTITAILLLQIVVGLLCATYLAKRNDDAVSSTEPTRAVRPEPA